jgi:hypothetical protein
VISAFDGTHLEVFCAADPSDASADDQVQSMAIPPYLRLHGIVDIIVERAFLTLGLHIIDLNP